MTHIQKQLTEIYENSGYSAALDFWKENANRIDKLSKNELSILKNTMNRYCLINNDSKTAEIILSDKKEQNIDNKKITESLFELGELYYKNVAPERNIIKAEELYTLAAEQGSVDDMYKLANMYKTGDCIPRNYEKAFFWLEKVALAGNKIAQFELGEMYKQGKGVEKSEEEAINWYKVANNSNSLSDMKIPDGVTCIEESAFEGFEILRSVTIPDSVKKIGDYAFKGCKNLEEVCIENIDNCFVCHNSFSDCDNLSTESKEVIFGASFKLVSMNGRDFFISNIIKENITWYDSIYFCNELSKKHGLKPVYSFISQTACTSDSFKNDNPHLNILFEFQPFLKGSVIQDNKANGYRLPSFEECTYLKNIGYSLEPVWCWDIKKDSSVSARYLGFVNERRPWANPNNTFNLGVCALAKSDKEFSL